MKKQLIITAMAAAVALSACKNDEPAAPAPASLDSNIQKVSYGIGLNIASNFKQQNVDLDKAAFDKGFEDGLSGAEPALDQQAIMTAMQEFQKAQMEKQLAERKAQEEKNKVESEKFLAENAKKEGVVTTDSGLQYRVISKGEEGAAKPTAEDTVKVHYRGKLIDGTEFDSSYSRNQPASFGVTAVIPGWTEALQLMSVGDKFELVIPSELAYGAGGAGAKIGPNATLVFEVELLEVMSAGERMPAESASSADAADKPSTN